MRRSIFALSAAVVLCGGAAVFPACSSDNGFGDDGGLGDSSFDVSSDQDFKCTNGTTCGDGGVCAGNVCCDVALACGNACCGGGQLCSFQKCVTPGGPCVDSSDCKVDEVCDYALGDNDAGVVPDSGSCQGGATTKTGRCMPKPPICAPDAGADGGGPVDCLEKCEYHGGGTFAPQLKYAWGGQITSPFGTDVMMAPIVVELDDDNCDGKVNENDIPEILFTSFINGQYTTNGTLHAISIVKGVVTDKWSKPGINPAGQLAGGDIDGIAGNEVVACGTDGAVHAFHGDGSVYWTSPIVSCYMPSIADLDGDGKPEVVVDGAILNGTTGLVKANYSAPMAGTFAVSDIDGDGVLDIVTSSQAYHADGTRFIDTGVPGNWPAIGDFDKSGPPEVVAVYYATHQISFWHYDANAVGKFSWVRQGVDINGSIPQHCVLGSAGYTGGGGPPTVADFNGDGTPDVALAGGIGYTVIDGVKAMNLANTNPQTILWGVTTTDCSSAATGSSVFDFDGDGKADVVYSDENYLRVYDGPTGTVKFSVCNTTGTLVEFPVIADVDNDGHADIVVVSNAYASGNPGYQCNDGKAIAQAGVRIFGDTAGSWVRTRRVWNQHAYHVTNVNEDGTIPKKELSNWTQPGLNNFRQNKQPGSEFAAPDAIVSVRAACSGPYGLLATVTNIGEAALPAGIVVGFYSGKPLTGTNLGQASTTQVLYPAQSETVFLALPNAPADVKSGVTPVYAVVDDTKVAHPSWHECRADNNVGTGSGGCQGPN